MVQCLVSVESYLRIKSLFFNLHDVIQCLVSVESYLRIKNLFFDLHDVMKTVGRVKIP